MNSYIGRIESIYYIRSHKDMRRFLSGLVLAAASSTCSFAADLPIQQPAQQPYVPPSAFTWSGYYLGITAGYVDGKHSFQTMGNEPATMDMIDAGRHPGSITNNINGFTGGVELGWNYQIPNTPFVTGLEADIQGGGGKASTLYSITAPGNTAPIDNITSRTEYLGTVRGRLGYAAGNVLFFGTGGLGYGGVDDGWSIIAPNQRRSFNDTSAVQVGWSAGGGIAWAFPSTGLILKAEYLHYDLGHRDFTFFGPNNLVVVPLNPNGDPRSFTSRIGVTADVVRLGLDYKF